MWLNKHLEPSVTQDLPLGYNNLHFKWNFETWSPLPEKYSSFLSWHLFLAIIGYVKGTLFINTVEVTPLPAPMESIPLIGSPWWRVGEGSLGDTSGLPVPWHLTTSVWSLNLRIVFSVLLLCFFIVCHWMWSSDVCCSFSAFLPLAWPSTISFT